MAARSTNQPDIDDLKASTSVTDAQLDSRIGEEKLWGLAGLLGNYELYVGRPGFDLNEADKADLKVCARDSGHQYAMQMAFTKWFDVTWADMKTYRSLVNILIELRKKTLAEKVCKTGELLKTSYIHTMC